MLDSTKRLLSLGHFGVDGSAHQLFRLTVKFSPSIYYIFFYSNTERALLNKWSNLWAHWIAFPFMFRFGMGVIVSTISYRTNKKYPSLALPVEGLEDLSNINIYFPYPSDFCHCHKITDDMLLLQAKLENNNARQFAAHPLALTSVDSKRNVPAIRLYNTVWTVPVNVESARTVYRPYETDVWPWSIHFHLKLCMKRKYEPAVRRICGREVTCIFKWTK